MIEWISVVNRLPEDSRMVLVTNGWFIGMTCYVKTLHGHEWEGDSLGYVDIHDPNCDYSVECSTAQITHWANLPITPYEVRNEVINRFSDQFLADMKKRHNIKDD